VKFSSSFWNTRRSIALGAVGEPLISYYFDGKEGLYQALSQQWQRRERELTPPGTPLPEQLRRHALEALHNPEGVRLLAWSGYAQLVDQDAAASTYSCERWTMIRLRVSASL
jgi:AcrR family transcriptional regulator